MSPPPKMYTCPPSTAAWASCWISGRRARTELRAAVRSTIAEVECCAASIPPSSSSEPPPRLATAASCTAAGSAPAAATRTEISVRATIGTAAGPEPPMAIAAITAPPATATTAARRTRPRRRARARRSRSRSRRRSRGERGSSLAGESVTGPILSATQAANEAAAGSRDKRVLIANLGELLASGATIQSMIGLPVGADAPESLP